MAEFKTPQKPKLVNLATPRKANEFINIPPSPFLKKLGYGTGIAVYQIERSPEINKLRSPWALKKLLKCKLETKEISRRLFEEAAILKKLDHPNIVGFRAFVKAPDGQNCLLMEKCSACLGDLIEVRNEEGLEAYPAKSILKVASDIAKALDYLHNKALILHADIKSHNILIKDDFSICKLCDFGVCLPLREDGTLDEEKAGNVLDYPGTVLWAPAEVLQENPVITSKADIFSYGLVLWEMLALIPPHSDNIFSDSANESMLDDSIGFHSEKYAGKRPALPSQELGLEYYHILEIFYCCTDENFIERPVANDLNLIMESINDI